MNKKLKITLIKEAQRNLIENPQDSFHDITHHYRTVLLAKKIVENVGVNCDLDLLEIFCWWHDVKVPGLNYEDKRVAEVVGEYLATKLPDKYKGNASDSIKNHEFGLQPKFTEGKILQDADKLEILSPERISMAIEAFEAEIENKEKNLGKYFQVVEDWLPKMPDKYNFEYSRQKHFEMLEIAKPYFDKVKGILGG